MRVHHLNAGTMRIPGAPIVSHVLLAESGDGLVLVDSGFGLAETRDRSLLGPVRHVMRPSFDEAETAVRQIQALGLDPADVRHVVLSHADLDHAGGIADFPHARVHLTAAEADAVLRPRWFERRRYRASQWSHGPDVVAHPPGPLEWYGFTGVTEILPGILLVPLPGHTRGHAGVAVRVSDDAAAPERWILHAGDAFNHHAYLTGARVPFLFWCHQTFVTDDGALARTQHARLARLFATHGDTVEVVCAHDPALLLAPAGARRGPHR
ncbi:MBL fold metallo-hydrolase [Myceligenerans crystallogenes]|uniref:MBL fold metallo-hydrolase n=1 Tax=Myceligenerans crystallogenes TaxID=316335 RepID=A0ABN2NAM0_9MICO